MGLTRSRSYSFSNYSRDEPVLYGFPLVDRSAETARIVAAMQAGDPAEQGLFANVLVQPSLIQLGEIVGIGSFAEVRKSMLQGRVIAAKIIKSSNARALERFKVSEMANFFQQTLQ